MRGYRHRKRTDPKGFSVCQSSQRPRGYISPFKRHLNLDQCLLDSRSSDSAVDANLNDQNDQGDTISELFEDLEQLVASPENRHPANPGEPTPEPSDLYNPSQVTPGAPSLPSARHKIARLPYHISTAYHSAIMCLPNFASSTEAPMEDLHEPGPIVPRKRRYPSHPHKDTQCKRSRQPQQLPQPGSPIQPVPLAVPVTPQKQRQISNDHDESDHKRCCTQFDFTSNQHIVRTSANHSSPQLHGNVTLQEPVIGLDRQAQAAYDDTQAHARTNLTPVTQPYCQPLRNHDSTNIDLATKPASTTHLL
ncbi:uncharacterized protein MELLADRAFT_93926 [Melampsora larici-populina 98AG31]|uniref:Uncharacterized protein n=1 Tax=Melampsora larici-populina (strain 98AG31 / pathotype 3-4-7) TaxID=747676 RepID=F4S5S5_MELLP|nr:uncharacterized protein MELLADRAFT_93926 [Melampsora larici-populina 98AG31]EGF99948.1 hypothetical protein MELLADRAFT_93926 [Melampsora larici-populina 98AG31]